MKHHPCGGSETPTDETGETTKFVQRPENKKKERKERSKHHK